MTRLALLNIKTETTTIAFLRITAFNFNRLFTIFLGLFVVRRWTQAGVNFFADRANWKTLWVSRWNPFLAAESANCFTAHG